MISNGSKVIISTHNEENDNYKNINNINNLTIELQTKISEDSGVSSRKSDMSTNNRSYDLHTNSKEDSNDFSRSYNHSNAVDNSKHELQSPVRSRGFKHPDFAGYKRKRNLINRVDSLICDNYGSQSTGLTQEIDCLDLGSSTPKKRKSKTPLKSVLKTR